MYGEKLDSGHFTRMPDGNYRWKFKPEDVRLLVFPDEQAKVMALSNAKLRSLFLEHTPIMLPLDDCANF